MYFSRTKKNYMQQPFFISQICQILAKKITKKLVYFFLSILEHICINIFFIRDSSNEEITIIVGLQILQVMHLIINKY
jgi:hypothetical protein